MTVGRQLPPLAGVATPVRLPPITRGTLASGLSLWSMPWHSVPVVTVALLLESGSSHDPHDRPGLASLVGDLIDEGAAGRDAIQISEAFALLGTQLSIDVGQDTTAISFTTLARNLDAALALLADIVIRPHLALSDLDRIRDLRTSRLRQLSTSASAIADRAFLQGAFGEHPYAHGTLGSTRGLQSASLDDARAFFERTYRPGGATLVVAGDVSAADVASAAHRRFGDWLARSGAEAPAVVPAPVVAPRCILIDRPGAPQSELRVGHVGPPRTQPAYPSLVTLNAALGGQFTSRINQLLRETKGFTYGARTGFDYRRACSTFGCDTSVQSDATVEAITDVLETFESVRSARPVVGEELARSKESVTRSYVVHFETPSQLVRAAAELIKFRLPDDTFDRFVPDVGAVTDTDVLKAAREFIRPEASTIVIVGDASKCRSGLSRFGRDIVETTPEF